MFTNVNNFIYNLAADKTIEKITLELERMKNESAQHTALNALEREHSKELKGKTDRSGASKSINPKYYLTTCYMLHGGGILACFIVLSGNIKRKPHVRLYSHYLPSGKP